MPRVFASLVAANLLLFLGSAGLGGFRGASSPDRHVLLAVLSLLLTCLIQVLAFTYLTVTHKVLVQAIHFGKLGSDAVTDAKRIKKGFARCIGAVMLLVVAAVATGASAWRSGDRHAVHLATVIVFVCGWSWLQALQYRLISRNAALLAETLASYQPPTASLHPKSSHSPLGPSQ